MLKDKVEIETWLNQHQINNYELIKDKIYGYIVNVHGDVFLSYKNLNKIDVKFNKINGSFYCNNNQLTSLEGCPKIVEESFYCNHNELISLIHSPKVVKNNFNCSSNKIISLNGMVKEIGGNFDCSNNNLLEITKLPITDKKINLYGNVKLKKLELINNYELLIKNNKNNLYCKIKHYIYILYKKQNIKEEIPNFIKKNNINNIYNYLNNSHLFLEEKLNIELKNILNLVICLNELNIKNNIDLNELDIQLLKIINIYKKDNFLKKIKDNHINESIKELSFTYNNYILSIKKELIELIEITNNKDIKIEKKLINKLK